MRVKSYFAQSVHEAMQRARCELGPEALLLSSKPGGEPHSGHAYEVVCGLANESQALPFAGAAVTVAGHTDVGQQLTDLKQQIEAMQRSLLLGPPSVSTRGRNEPDDLVERVVELGFSLPLAQELVEAARLRALLNLQPEETADDIAAPLPESQGRTRLAVRRTQREPNPEHALSGLLDEVESRVSVAPKLGCGQQDQKVVLLVGPAGAGKTTTLVKLAVAYGTSPRLPLQILSTDTLRLGGAEQLQAYARIIGAGFQTVAGRHSLEQALLQFRAKLLLIDSPGFTPANMEEARELRSFVAQHSDVDVHLVLPATLTVQVIRRVIERFRILRPGKLIFTHVDEMQSPGPLFEAAMFSQLPVSFLANGQQIPEDLLEASKPDLRLKFAARLNQGSAAAA